MGMLIYNGLVQGMVTNNFLTIFSFGLYGSISLEQWSCAGYGHRYLLIHIPLWIYGFYWYSVDASLLAFANSGFRLLHALTNILFHLRIMHDFIFC